MLKVLMMPPFSGEDVKLVEVEGCRIAFSPQPTTEELSQAEVILGEPTLEEIAQAPNLHWLQITSAGTDRYTQRGTLPERVVLTNATGAFGPSISEFVLAMTLMLMKGLHRYRDNQNQKLWRDEGWQHSPMGKRVLILGAGDIGTCCAQKLKPFGCHITGVRRKPGEGEPPFDEVVTLAEAERLLGEADLVICALPNTHQTRGWMNRSRLERLKPTAYLINVGRGNFVDDRALAELLSAGRLAGAAVDVTDPEPLPPDHPLWTAPNAIVTPHITGGSFGHLQETTQFIYRLCRENLRRYLMGEELENVVDRQTGYRRKI